MKKYPGPKLAAEIHLYYRKNSAKNLTKTFKTWKSAMS